MASLAFYLLTACAFLAAICTLALNERPGFAAVLVALLILFMVGTTLHFHD